jgi:hypothetical protein
MFKPSTYQKFGDACQRLIELGEDKATVAEHARRIINGRSWFSENSMDERGNLTCYASTGARE